MKRVFLFASVFLCVLRIEKSVAQLNVDETKEAVKLEAKMFEAIGGVEKWANIRSLYIKATHTEPSMDKPYQSEIWRGTDEFKLRIEQQNEDFHKIGLFSEDGGWIHDLKKNRIRKLSTENLDSERKGHIFNVYVLLKDIASSKKYSSVINGQRLEFYKDKAFMVAFILDDQYRPKIFITKNNGGEENISHFDLWNETNGFVHSAGGGPVNGNFHYRTEIWQPSKLPFEEAFDVKYSEL